MVRNKPRKSPYKHQVRQHTRGGRTVHSYKRGSGDKPRPAAPRRRKLVETIKKKRPEGVSDSFAVRVQYEDASFEHVNVTAPDYTGALDSGIESRHKLKAPAVIRMRRR